MTLANKTLWKGNLLFAPIVCDFQITNYKIVRIYTQLGLFPFKDFHVPNNSRLLQPDNIRCHSDKIT